MRVHVSRLHRAASEACEYRACVAGVSVCDCVDVETSKTLLSLVDEVGACTLSGRLASCPRGSKFTLPYYTGFVSRPIREDSSGGARRLARLVLCNKRGTTHGTSGPSRQAAAAGARRGQRRAARGCWLRRASRAASRRRARRTSRGRTASTATRGLQLYWIDDCVYSRRVSFLRTSFFFK